jgi:multidrug resistance efflux pump
MTSASPTPDNPSNTGPTPLSRRKRPAFLLGMPAALLLLAGSGAGYALLHRPARAAHDDLVLHRVEYERLEFPIIQRGDLEPAPSSDIECRVKAGSKNGTVATIIKWVIDDGSAVKGPRPEKPTGDLLIELDDSGLREQLLAQKIAVARAESDRIHAEEAYKITVSQNDSDIKTAETQVDLAALDLVKYTGLSREAVLELKTLAWLRQELNGASRNGRRSAQEVATEDLKKYRSGDYLATLQDSLGQLESAESDLAQEEDREVWTYRMVKKGYQTRGQAQAETSRREAYQLALNKQLLNLDVLVKYTKVSQLTQYLRALEEAQRGLSRAKAQAHAREVQARTDREANKSIWELERRRYQEYEAEIAKCKIYAPHDGVVLYFTPEQVRSGGGSQMAIVAQGEPVREGQRLLRLPDLTHLQISTRVHEALVSHLGSGQPALIRIDAYPEKTLHGHVQHIAGVATKVNWGMVDLGVYMTEVALDPADLEGLDLKPGMSAEATITGAAAEHVLAVPTRAIVGGTELGAERKVFVMTSDGPEERTVTIGASNKEMAEIKSGLNEGDEIVVNPAVLAEDENDAR